MTREDFFGLFVGLFAVVFALIVLVFIGMGMDKLDCDNAMKHYNPQPNWSKLEKMTPDEQWPLTPFQQQLMDAANFMILSQTVSGVAIKEGRDKFRALLERALDVDSLLALAHQEHKCRNQQEKK